MKSATIAMALYIAILILALIFTHSYTDYTKIVITTTCVFVMNMLYAIALWLDLVKELLEYIAVKLDNIEKRLARG